MKKIVLYRDPEDQGSLMHVIGCETGHRPVFLFRLPMKVLITMDGTMDKVYSVHHDADRCVAMCKKLCKQ